MEDIMRIVKSFEEAGLIIQQISEKFKTEIKQ